MSKAPKILPSVKAIVYQAALDAVNKDRRLLATELQSRLKALGIKAIPAEETLQKMISWARNNSSDPEDRPWSVSALAFTGGDIPLAALPLVMKVWAKAVAKDTCLTIRQAKWIARLCFIYKGDTDISLTFLALKASEYANREKAIKLAEAYPDKLKDMRWLWFSDALLYSDMGDKDPAVARRLMEMYGIEHGA
jgi:hypothetical protein